MALPVTITGVNFPVENYYLGPFKVGTSFYVVVVDTAVLEMWKADGDDPTDAWSEVEAAGHPTGADSGTASVWCVVDGTTIYVASMENQVPSASNELHLNSFDTTGDTWTLSGGPEGQVQAITDGPTFESVSIAVRSDGDIIILYGGDEDKEMGVDRDRVDYARWEGSSWTIVSVDNEAAGSGAELLDYHGSVVVKGSSDRMHFFLSIESTNDLYQRTLTSGNSLQGWPSAYETSATASHNHAHHHGISYDDGGTQRVRVPFMDDNQQISYAEFDSSDTPTPTVNADISDNDAATAAGMPSVGLNDGTDEWLIYTGGGINGADRSSTCGRTPANK